MPLTRIKSTGIANTESYTLGSASITGNLTVSSVTTLGNVGNVRITGGVADYVLRTDGSGNLSWVAQTGGGGGAGTDNVARQTANAAFIQANAAFNAANSGGGGNAATTLSVTVDSFVANGNTTTFTLSATPESKSYTSVIVDGVSQLQATYGVFGNIIIFDSTFVNGSNVQVTTISKSPGPDNLGYFNRIYTGDNTTTSFAVTTGVTNNSIIVTENGIIQSPNTHYYVSGSNVIFRIAPTSTINIGIRELASTGNITAGSGAPQYITLSQPGSITSPFTGVARLYPPKNITISNVYASLGTTSSTPFVFVLEKNGINVGSYTISSNTHKMNVVLSNIVVTTDDYLTMDISSGTGATDLRVDLQYT